MATSGTYLFSSAKVGEIVEIAYRRIGVIPAEICQDKIDAALSSLNCILSMWCNQRFGLKLWTVQPYLVSIKPSQYSYELPPHTQDIVDAQLRESVRNLGGTAASSSGIAQNAFDGNNATACIETAPNGNISYAWGTGFSIEMVGVQSNVTRSYTLVFEYSNDGVTWTSVGSPPLQDYTQGVISWFVISVPTFGTSFRVRETGGATLNIQELYFNSQINDTVISPLSRAEWSATPRKNQPGRPSSYVVFKDIDPYFNIWPTPTLTYNCIYMHAITKIQDVGMLSNTPQIPSLYIQPLAYALAHELALQDKTVSLDKLDRLKMYSEEAFKIACDEDRERVPTRIYGSFMTGWTRA